MPACIAASCGAALEVCEADGAGCGVELAATVATWGGGDAPTADQLAASSFEYQTLYGCYVVSCPSELTAAASVAPSIVAAVAVAGFAALF
jgi:hypothetical protein